MTRCHPRLPSLASVAVFLALGVAVTTESPAADVPFTPDWASLQAGYKTPDWFRDAKFGIFLHWGPCSVPAAANDGWYGRQMYMQHGAPWGRAYAHHVATYGHPSEFGYKDVLPLWKAEKWDPAALAAFFKSCGARYLVPVAVHHDNFDCYDSSFQPWNSVRIGPHRDIIGGWRDAAAAVGLRFGVSSHSDRTWGWFQTSRGADTTGPRTGVRYDGWLTKADGVGTWWEGLDPQDLYSPPHEGSAGPAYERFVGTWRQRTDELLTKYQPDLVYFDGGLPFDKVGLGIAADFYNANRARHGGKLEAVLNIKGGAPLTAVTHDIEKGQTDRILPLPWQTDTSLNNHWYADRLPLVLADSTSVIHLLADIVSKNGNLLLNLGLEADGTLPDDQRAILAGVGTWLEANGPAIYGTRPTRTWGEGPTRITGGSFNQRSAPYTARDFRFTCRGDTLYAIALGLPADRHLRIRSLGPDGPFQGRVTRVRLLGGKNDLPFTISDTGLDLTLPEGLAPTPALTLVIDGLDHLAHDAITRPDLDGTIDLGAFDAAITGGIRMDDGTLGYWNDSRDTVSWRFASRRGGTYDVVALAANPTAGSVVRLQMGEAGKPPVEALVSTPIPATAGWSTYRTVHLGTVEVAPGADQTLTLVPQRAGWAALNLRSLRLVPRPAGSPPGWCALTQDATGTVDLPADQAELTGKTLRLEGDNLGWWNVRGEAASWTFRVRQPGTYRIECAYALEDAGAGSRMQLDLDTTHLEVVPAATGGWGNYRTRTLGLCTLTPGDHRLTLTPTKIITGAMNLRQITLRPVDSPDPAPAMGAADTAGAALPVCR